MTRATRKAAHLYAIGIGSNRRHIAYGRPTAVVEGAIAALDGEFSLFDASPILTNPAMGGAGRDFANAAAIIESTLEPDAMLRALKAIERRFGRRAGRRWGERVLDLDILAWSGGRYAARGLTIPHPGLASRPFALVPLATIAPRWKVAGPLTLAQMEYRLRRAMPEKKPDSA
ncbi:2-amino-4-hydroxy-6-hydroxymethyldihydropteridine diphosphokinase [Sphingomicrobium lutaoense]|uniref:2-amino-4-hydroxy-6-hydroxymethyldihydropteridine pyrophosphokinase n=1 Tax=Sphingomicrobium lutaoense TaxID=515949 RepID=A0A839Z2U1_9SPHN|nr:2-amino-4-hydroxy-6-hydroxymethyldihydropteridine diphosphokinase [Sphingomicrobium lutaoense]MBB3763942.1 2-amino-4-hydroxy-6-hydroxymethyldihydropteridine diphosphokinase [Sphingomicrobium lutaoense]